MLLQPSDRFVSRAHTSQQLILFPLMLCFRLSFPIDYLAASGELRREGNDGRAGLLERVQWKFSQLWQAVDSWTTSSGFPPQRGWNFSPWKSRVINDWGSQNNLWVCFFFVPTLSLFFLPQILCPGRSSALTGPGMIANVIMSKYFTPKRPSTALVLCWFSKAHSCSRHSVVHVVRIIPWPQPLCSSWSEVSHPPMFFSQEGFEEVRSADETVVRQHWCKRSD